MRISERVYKSNQPPPKQCTYCDEEKSFLMLKPQSMVVNGEVFVNVNLTNTTRWICLECLSLDMDALGYTIDIYEYKY